MAFDWLDAAGGAYNLFRAFRGRKEPESTKQQRKAARRAERARRDARKLVSAAADPTSSKFRNLEGLYTERNRRDLVGAIDQIMRQNARARARGDVGFGINPERRDESRYRALARAFQEAREGSRLEARNTLLAAAQQMAGTAQGVGFPVQAGEERGKQNFDLFTTGLTGVKPLAQRISEIFDRPGTSVIAPSAPRLPYGHTGPANLGGLTGKPRSPFDYVI